METPFWIKMPPPPKKTSFFKLKTFGKNLVNAALTVSLNFAASKTQEKLLSIFQSVQ